MARVGRSHRQRRGVLLVEAALVLPVVMLLTFAAMEYGWAFYNLHLITNAARSGVRVAVRADATSSDVTATVNALMSAAGLGGSGYTTTITPGDPSTLGAGTTVNVTVSVAYSGGIEIVGLPLVPVPNVLRGSVAMAKEGP